MNYWIAGLLYNELIRAGDIDDAHIFDSFVHAYTLLQKLYSGDDRAEKIAWFEAGVAGDTALPQQPARFNALIPGKPSSRKLQWFIGSVSGED